MVDLGRLDSRIIALEGDIIALTRQLVRTNTVNPYSGDPDAAGEEAGQKIVEALLGSLGASRVHCVQPREGVYQRMGVLGPADRCFTGRDNVIGHFSFPHAGPTFLVNGHMDTVGTVGMTVAPFGAELREGRIYGRGSADQKGTLAAALVAIKALLEQADQLGGELIFMSVVDEECNGAGAGTLACVEAGLRADGGLLTDGFDYKLCHTANGMITAEVFVEGRSAHSSAPDAGVSAIDKTILVKAGIDRFIEARRMAAGSLPVNLGVLRSGTLPSMVAGEGYLSLNAEYAPEEAGDGECLRQQLVSAIDQQIRSQGDTWLAAHPPRVTLMKDFAPVAVPEHAGVVGNALRAACALFGEQIQFHRFIPTCDGGHLFLRGGVPMVFFGTPELSQCHTPTESVAVKDLLAAARMYGRLMALQLAPQNLV